MSSTQLLRLNTPNWQSISSRDNWASKIRPIAGQPCPNQTTEADAPTRRPKPGPPHSESPGRAAPTEWLELARLILGMPQCLATCDSLPYSCAMRVMFRMRSASPSQQGKSSPRSAFFAIIASGATAFSTQVTP